MYRTHPQPTQRSFAAYGRPSDRPPWARPRARPSLGATALATAAGLFSSLAPHDAAACGGLFCGGPVAPVVQTGEGIIFAVDEAAGTVEAVINIRYQGAPNDFAWLLPLQSAPLDIGVAPGWAFAVADQLTAPVFQLRQEVRGACAEAPELSFGADEASVQRVDQNSGVTVISRERVGPYESVVLDSRDPALVRGWLEQNAYVVTSEMMESVVPYLAKGDVLLALRLRKDRDTGDIQPISLRLATTEACVPIRMTAIAAQADMDITAFVLSRTGRAIPSNYFHVDLNLARIDWLTGGGNYRQVVSAAADEGEGNAFTTEYSGPANIFAGRVTLEGRVSLDAISAAGDQADLMFALQGLAGVGEVGGILLRHLSPERVASLGLDASQLAGCPACFAANFSGLPVDALAAAYEVENTLVDPSIAVQSMFDRFNHLTRLYTLISPEEMNVDPIFTFAPGLPNVSNVHTARLVLDCGIGGARQDAEATLIIDETGQEIELGSASPGGGDRTILDQMPGSTRVEQLAEDRLVTDNTALIQSLLAEHNARIGCGCSSSPARGRPGDRAKSLGLAAAIFGLVLLRGRAPRTATRR